MKTKVVDGKDIDPKKGLRAEDYMDREVYLNVLGSNLEHVWQHMRDIAYCCHRTSKSKGWWEEQEGGRAMTATEIAMKLCLIHSEVSEALEEVRGGGNITETRFSIGRLAGDALPVRPGAEEAGDKPEGFASELADIVIRVFDLAGGLGIDIAEVIRLKMAFNETRPHKHGGKAI